MARRSPLVISPASKAVRTEPPLRMAISVPISSLIASTTKSAAVVSLFLVRRWPFSSATLRSWSISEIFSLKITSRSPKALSTLACNVSSLRSYASMCKVCMLPSLPIISSPTVSNFVPGEETMTSLLSASGYLSSTMLAWA